MRGLIALYVVAAMTLPATAAVPETLHYQGYLTNAVGDPVHCPDLVACPDESFALTFRLYDAAVGGDPLWVETHLNVPVVRGTFDVVLGGDLPLDPADVVDPAWLGVEINGAGEMSPRQRLVSTAFALRAGSAETAGVANLADDADRLGGLDAVEYARLSDLEGLCVTDDELTEVLAESRYIDTPGLTAYLTEEGYVPGAHFSGEWADLTGTPEDLLDGDDDTLAMMSCESGAVLRFDGLGWGCAIDRVLTADEVDGIVADKGYALSALLAAVATSGSYDDLTDLPPALAKLSLTEDGSLSFGDTVIINAAGEWAGSPTGLQGPPGQEGAPGVGVASAEVNSSGQLVVSLTDETVYTSASLVGPTGDPGDDGALAGLECEAGQVVKRGVTGWACAADAQVSEAEVLAWVTGGALDLAPGSSIGGEPIASTSDAGAQGTLIYMRCPWVAAHAVTIGECTPSACPDGWQSLGITANVKTGSTATGSSSAITNDYYTTSHGYQERACYQPVSVTVLQPRCSWEGAHATAIGSCVPPACPDDWQDLGVTGLVIASATATGSSSAITNDYYTTSHGYQERTCIR
jgi:hypothetical protein